MFHSIRVSSVTVDASNYEAQLQQQLASGLQQMKLDVAEADQRKLVQYVTTLHKWNKTHNLTAVRNPEQMITRHLLDSLSIAKYLNGQSLLDVGSGAGLPGIPLAIVEPHLNVTCVDSVLKKTRFMLFAASSLELGNVSVKHARVEELDVEELEHDGGYDMIVARAFSSIEKLCALTGHLLAADGQILAMIGKPLEAELQSGLINVQLDSGSAFSVTRAEKLLVPGETAQRNIVILQKSAAS